MVGGAACGGWGYLRWVGYLWWVGLLVVGRDTYGGWGYLWWAGLLYYILYNICLAKLWMLKLWVGLQITKINLRKTILMAQNLKMYILRRAKVTSVLSILQFVSGT